MCVFKSEAGGIDAEATIGSASLEILSEGIKLHSWDTWLNSGTGRNIALSRNLLCMLLVWNLGILGGYLILVS